MKYINKNVLLLFCLLLLCAACKKKLDFEYDNRDNSLVRGNSMVRLINTTEAKELIINGDSLTSFIGNPSGGTYSPIGTRYFPQTGRLGLTYFIPQEFVNKQNIIPGIVFGRYDAVESVERSTAFSAENKFDAPVDYYLTWFKQATGGRKDSVFKIPRGVTAPANPANIKIRLLNLSSSADPAGLNGPLKLTYSNGEEVDSRLSDVSAGSFTDYIEIPWGTYQFRVLTADGKILPGAGVPKYNRLTYGTTSVDLSNGQLTNLTYAPTRTYQPGGVYTIAVSANGFTWTDGNDDYRTLLNSFRIITDVNSVNTSYGRVQAVNVIPDEPISVSIGDKKLATGLAYAQPSSYSPLIAGDYEIKVSNNTGQIASLPLKITTGDNYTAWVYQKPSGEYAVALVANNLSATMYIFDPRQPEQDGSYSQQTNSFPFYIRCLNFCQQLSESTFTLNDGQLFNGYESASQHIGFAQTNALDPYISLAVSYQNSLQAYQSKPGVAPGDRLWEVEPLLSTSFIANPALYKNGLPKSEPGIYTVALIGSLKTGVPVAQKARMIIVKHIK